MKTETLTEETAGIILLWLILHGFIFLLFLAWFTGTQASLRNDPPCSSTWRHHVPCE